MIPDQSLIALAGAAIDINPSTFWHTQWGTGVTALPHSITDWGKPVPIDEFPPGLELQRVTFPHPVEARFLKLVALSAFDDQPFASITEFDAEY